MKHSIECLNFTPPRKNSLVGFADIRIAELRLIIRDVALHDKNGVRWASPPGKPMIDANGVALRDDKGKIRYAPILEFDTRETKNACSGAVWAAVLARNPAELKPHLEGVP